MNPDRNSEIQDFKQSSLRAALASIVATSIVLGFDLQYSRGPMPEGGPSAVFGFGTVVCSILILAALIAILFQSILYRLSARPPRQILSIGLVLPAIPLLIRTARLLFSGGSMKRYEYHGGGPLIVGLVMVGGIVLAYSITRRILRRKFGRVIAFSLFMAMAAILLRLDLYLMPHLYGYLHQLLVVAIYVSVACAIYFLTAHIPKRRSLQLAGMALVFVIGVLGWQHLSNFMRESSPDQRQLIGIDLNSSSRLWLLFPYVRDSREIETPPDGLSTRAMAHLEQRGKARDKIALKRKAVDLRNIIIISVDAVRYDHTSLANYERDTTPFLKSIAAEGVSFTSARSPSTASFYSLHSMLSGCSPTTLSSMEGKNPELLAEHLSSLGWSTAAFFSEFIFSVRDRSWPDPDLTLGFKDVFRSKSDAKPVVDDLLNYLDAKRGEHIFAFAHLMNPHAPYEKREEAIWGMELMDLYDGELAHVDAQLKRLYEGLMERGIAEKTILIFTSDHGEAFGEAGQYQHGGPPNLIQSSIPLVIHAPGLYEPRIIEASVSNSSIPATLVDTLGISSLANDESPSLLPLLLDMEEGSSHYCVVERPSFSQNPGVSPVRSFVHEGYEYVVDLGLGVGRLFDTKLDPLQRDNIAASNPSVLETLRSIEKEWRDDRLLYSMRNTVDSDFPREYLSLRGRIRAGDVRALSELHIWISNENLKLREDAAIELLDALSRIRINDLNLDLSIFQSVGLGAVADILAVKQGEIERAPKLIESLGQNEVRLEEHKIRTLAGIPPLVSELPRLEAQFLSEQSSELKFALACLLARWESAKSRDYLLQAIELSVGENLDNAIAALSVVCHGHSWQQLVNVGNKRKRDVLMLIARHAHIRDSQERREWLIDQFRSVLPSRRADALNGVLRFDDDNFKQQVFELVARYELDQRFRSTALSNARKIEADEVRRALFTDLCSVETTVGSTASSYLVAEGVAWNDNTCSVSTERRLSDEAGQISILLGSRPEKSSQRGTRIYLVCDFPAEALGSELVVRVGAQEVRVLSLQERRPVVVLEPEVADPTVELQLRSRGDLHSTWSLNGVVSVPIRTHDSLWPEDLPTVDSPYSYSRFEGNFYTTPERSNCLWFRGRSGCFHFQAGSQVRRELRLGVRTRGPCRLRVKLNESELLDVEIQGDSDLNIPVLDGSFRASEPNSLNFEIVGPGKALDSEDAPVRVAWGVTSINWN